MNLKKIKTFRFFDAVLCLTVAVLAVLIFFSGNSKKESQYFTVNCDGSETVYRLDKAQTLEFVSNGIKLKVICDGQSVWVEESECPDKYCVNKGKISRFSQTAVCAPARFSVSIDGEDGYYDAHSN